jgi:hypothetical protein
MHRRQLWLCASYWRELVESSCCSLLLSLCKLFGYLGTLPGVNEGGFS